MARKLLYEDEAGLLMRQINASSGIGGSVMLQWSFVFLVVGLIAAVLNVSVHSAPWSDILAVVFFSSLLLFCSTLVGDFLQRRPHPRLPSGGSKEKTMPRKAGKTMQKATGMNQQRTIDSLRGNKHE